MSLLSTYTHASRLHDIRFAPRPSGPGELLLAAAEDKSVLVFEVDGLPVSDNGEPSKPVLLAKLTGHLNRYAVF